MGFQRAIALVAAALMLTGCVNSTVREWAAIGAASGAAAGAGVGYLISDPDLAGSTPSTTNGDVSLERGPTVLSGLVIGAVFGAIVGAMVGHHRYDPEQDSLDARLDREAETGGVQINVDLGGLDDEESDDNEEMGLDDEDTEGLDEEDADEADATDDETDDSEDADSEDELE